MLCKTRSDCYTDSPGAQAYYPLYVEPSGDSVDVEMDEPSCVESEGCTGAGPSITRAVRGRTITKQATFKHLTSQCFGSLRGTSRKFKVLISNQCAHPRLLFSALFLVQVSIALPCHPGWETYRCVHGRCCSTVIPNRG